jgi:phosphatidylserine/phosphatidylglycerophosphate/cardiolipin synthase-like enzyme
MRHRQIHLLYQSASKSEINLFLPGAASELAELSAGKVLGLSGDDEEDKHVLTALRAIAVSLSENPEIAPKLVATVPKGFPFASSARPTADVALEMVSDAKREILIYAYHLSNDDLIKQLQRFLSTPRRRLRIIGDAAANLPKLRDKWPAKARPDALELFEYVKRADLANTIDASRDRYPILHAKVLVIDQTECLIGSANFTTSAFDKWNFEIGVRLRRPSLAKTLWDSAANLPSTLFRKL